MSDTIFITHVRILCNERYTNVCSFLNLANVWIIAVQSLFQLFFFHFSLECQTVVFIVVSPGRCLSLTLHTLNMVLFIWSIKALSEFKEKHNVCGMFVY